MVVCVVAQPSAVRVAIDRRSSQPQRTCSIGMCSRAQMFSSTFFKNKTLRLFIHFPARSGLAPGALPGKSEFSQLCEPWQPFTYHVDHTFLPVRGRSLVIILRTRRPRGNRDDYQHEFSKLACVNYKSACVCNPTGRDLWSTKIMNGCKRPR